MQKLTTSNFGTEYQPNIQVDSPEMIVRLVVNGFAERVLESLEQSNLSSSKKCYYKAFCCIYSGQFQESLELLLKSQRLADQEQVCAEQESTICLAILACDLGYCDGISSFTVNPNGPMTELSTQSMQGRFQEASFLRQPTCASEVAFHLEKTAILVTCLGETKEAFDCYTRLALLRGMTVEIGLAKARLFLIEGNESQYIKEVKAVSQFFPDRFEPYFVLGRYFLAKQDYVGAETSFRQALERDPANEIVRKGLLELKTYEITEHIPGAFSGL